MTIKVYFIIADNKLSDSEFTVFYRLFILPYEFCLESDDYFLDKNETLNCYKGTMVEFRIWAIQFHQLQN